MASSGSPTTTTESTLQTISATSGTGDSAEGDGPKVMTVQSGAAKRTRSTSNTPVKFSIGTPRSRATSSKRSGSVTEVNNALVAQHLDPIGSGAPANQGVERDAIQDATLEDFLNMEIDDFVPEVDDDEEERSAKALRLYQEVPPPISMEMSVHMHNIQLIVIQQRTHDDCEEEIERISTNSRMPGYEVALQKFNLAEADNLNKTNASAVCYKAEAERLRQEKEKILEEARLAHDELLGRLQVAWATIERFVSQGHALASQHAQLIARHQESNRENQVRYARASESVKTGKTMAYQLSLKVAELQRKLEEAMRKAEADKEVLRSNVSQLREQLDVATATASTAKAGDPKINTEMLTDLFDTRAQCNKLKAEVATLKRQNTAQSSAPGPGTVTKSANSSCFWNPGLTAAMLNTAEAAKVAYAVSALPEKIEPNREAFLSPEGSVDGSQISMQMVQSLQEEMEKRMEQRLEQSLAKAEQARCDEQYDLQCKWEEKMKKLKGEVKAMKKAKRDTSDKEDQDGDNEEEPPTIAFTTM
jgi:hypothetical protein